MASFGTTGPMRPLPVYRQVNEVLWLEQRRPQAAKDPCRLVRQVNQVLSLRSVSRALVNNFPNVR
jgi:hypothetical protein